METGAKCKKENSLSPDPRKTHTNNAISSRHKHNPALKSTMHVLNSQRDPRLNGHANITHSSDCGCDVRKNPSQKNGKMSHACSVGNEAANGHEIWFCPSGVPNSTFRIDIDTDDGTFATDSPSAEGAHCPISSFLVSNSCDG